MHMCWSHVYSRLTLESLGACVPIGVRARERHIKTLQCRSNHSSSNDANDTHSLLCPTCFIQESAGREGSSRRKGGGGLVKEGRISLESSVWMTEERPSKIKRLFFLLLVSFPHMIHQEKTGYSHGLLHII